MTRPSIYWYIGSLSDLSNTPLFLLCCTFCMWRYYPYFITYPDGIWCLHLYVYAFVGASYTILSQMSCWIVSKHFSSLSHCFVLWCRSTILFTLGLYVIVNTFDTFNFVRSCFNVSDQKTALLYFNISSTAHLFKNIFQYVCNLCSIFFT